jgi:hypothetical protein
MACQDFGYLVRTSLKLASKSAELLMLILLLNQLLNGGNVRVRIEVDIQKPLKPGIFLLRTGLHDTWIGLKYEKLPELCFKCGVIGHAKKDCLITRAFLTNPFGIRFLAFGEWIKLENVKEPPDIYTKITIAPSTASTPNNSQEFQLPAVVPPPDRVDLDNVYVGLATEKTNCIANLGHAPTSTCSHSQGKVLSFAKLLEQSLQKDAGTQRTYMAHDTNLEGKILDPLTTLVVCSDTSEVQLGISQVDASLNSPLAHPFGDIQVSEIPSTLFSNLVPDTYEPRPEIPNSPIHATTPSTPSTAFELTCEPSPEISTSPIHTTPRDYHVQNA